MPVKQFKRVKEIVDIGTEEKEIDEKEYEKGEAHTITDEEREFKFFNGPGELKSDFLQASQWADPTAKYFIAYDGKYYHATNHHNHRWWYKTNYLITRQRFSKCTERTRVYPN